MIESGGSYQTVGFFLSRGLAFVYLIAFTIFYRQYTSLVGENGIKPIQRDSYQFFEKFSLFYFLPYDRVINSSAILGILISGSLVLGINEILGIYFSIASWFLLWLIFISFLNSGDIFTKPGWESLLAESGFLAIFLGAAGYKTPETVIWLFRWVLFRMVFGSAVVKLRGSKKWNSLSDIKNFFISQPFPGPLSWHLYNLPERVNRVGSFTILSSMLIIPFFYFAPQPYAAIAGLITVLIQILIFFSGNFAWLNILTAVLAISTLNDSIINSITGLSIEYTISYPFSGLLTIIGFIIILLSYKPVINFFSTEPDQNAIYNPLHIANSYGAFPSIPDKHFEIVIEAKKNGVWKQYQLNSSFIDETSKPKQIAPYHHMFEYLTYFYVHDKLENSEWLERFLEKIKKDESKSLNLLKEKPISDNSPEKVRAVKYEYKFTDKSGEDLVYWIRKRSKVLKTVN